MIVITGGTGFIGSNLVAGLEAQGADNLVVCDTLGSSDKWRNIAKRTLRDFVHPQNLLAYLEEHKKEIKVIFHMGAISSTTEKDADLIVDTNFILTRALWRFCAKNNVRFIYASSAATYGDGNDGFKDDDGARRLRFFRPCPGARASDFCLGIGCGDGRDSDREGRCKGYDCFFHEDPLLR